MSFGLISSYLVILGTPLYLQQFLPHQHTFHRGLFPASNTAASDMEIRSSASAPRENIGFCHVQDSTNSWLIL